MSFAQAIDELVSRINEKLELLFSSGVKYFDTPIPQSQKADLQLNYDVTLDSQAYKVEGTENSETSEAIVKFNESVDSQIKQFVVLSAQSKIIDALLKDIVTSPNTNNGVVQEEHLVIISKICCILDFLIYLVSENRYPSQKADFYQLVKNVLDTLFDISTDYVSTFWKYMETRKQDISKYIFDPSVTSHRISLLLLCNGLTDKYFTRVEGGRLNSYEKDTFNDQFQAQVRLFLAGLFDFEDLTGLNKHYLPARRVSKEPAILRSKSSDDRLLGDVFQLYKLLREPYISLKQPRQLSQHEASMARLANYMLDEEEKLKSRTAASQKLKRQPKDSGASRVFFAEEYWLTPFEKDELVKNDAKNADYEHALKSLDSSKFRRSIIFQIFLASHFFSELLQSRKKQLLASANAPQNVKHMVEEYVPDDIAQRFNELKKKIILRCQAFEPCMGLLLGSLSHSEEQWWSWLLYSKDESGKPIFSNENLSEENKTEAKEKYEKLFPLKTKRYFNLYATPQLSRKMKTPTGINLLENEQYLNLSYDEQINELDEKIAGAEGEEKEQLREQRTVLAWKRLKLLRSDKWLELDTLLNEEELGLPEQKDAEMDVDEAEQNKESEEKATANGEKASPKEEQAEAHSDSHGDHGSTEDQLEHPEAEPKQEQPEDTNMELDLHSQGQSEEPQTEKTTTEEPAQESRKRARSEEAEETESHKKPKVEAEVPR